MRVTTQYLVNIMRRGALRNAVAGILPGRLVSGPFRCSIDLGTALTAGQEVADLRDASIVDDPQLEQVGIAGSAAVTPDVTLFVNGALLVLGGANADALDPGDLARIQSALYLRHQAGDRTRYAPIGVSAGLARVQSQRTQGTAADGNFGATARPLPVDVMPMMRIDYSTDPFHLYSHVAVPTFAGSADLDESVLYLYGMAIQTALLQDPNGDPCADPVKPPNQKNVAPPPGSVL